MDLQDIMQKQPIINIGTIGHVANGKSTVIKALTNIQTQRHSNELKRGITIKSGYSNCKIYKCDNCPSPEAYESTSSDVNEMVCKICDSEMKLINHVSFVDNPGHHSLMMTMMNSSSVIDTALLVESVENYKVISQQPLQINFPAQQTIQHIDIIEKIGIPIEIVSLNKFDLVPKPLGTDIIKYFGKYLSNQKMYNQIVPISATLGLNIDVVAEFLGNLKPPERQYDEEFKMLVIRSFNINQQRIKINELKGGVIGGSLVRGTIKVGDKVSIYPGFVEQHNDKWKYTPLETRVLSINSDHTPLDVAYPGGLIGIQLDIDSALSTNDQLIGQILIPTNPTKKLYVYEEIVVKLNEKYTISKPELLQRGKKLNININSNNINCSVKIYDPEENVIGLKLSKALCMEHQDKVLLIDDIENGQINIIGVGIIIGGLDCLTL